MTRVSAARDVFPPVRSIDERRAFSIGVLDLSDNDLINAGFLGKGKFLHHGACLSLTYRPPRRCTRVRHRRF